MIRNIKQIGKIELGFTLIEVMVVIIMVGILAAIAVPIYTNYVYRARTAEAVSTVGAIKTFMLERANATGSWPDPNDMNNEFNNFNELYYFQSPTIVGPAGDPIADDTHIAIRMLIDSTTFGKTATTNDYLQLDIDTEVTDNNGWSGDIRDEYATHLPECTSPRSS